jgi:RNA-binding protein Musashi
MQFGRVVDATLMIDKDTGRPRGFGFVTFDSETAVDNALSRPLEILGKPIEVKKAQPRGNLRDEDRGGRRGGRDGGGYRDMNHGGESTPQQGGQQGMAGGMTPQMMAQYWQRMQQYFAMMQQQMAMAGQGQPQGMAAGMMGGMNPAMLQQMQQMQQMKGMGGNPQQPQGSMSPNPNPQSPGSSQSPMPNMMNPAMMQQMQNQGQGPAAAAAGASGNGGASPGPNAAYNRQPGGPGYNAQEQIAFEQQKYEQQQVRRHMENRAFSPYQQGGPTSWEGMYDEVPQPNNPGGSQGMHRRPFFSASFPY